ncbi:hypothetical protein ACUXAV_000316 [Cupriavidus metallidurans]|uniref:hypothetical protein n=1 Tax=Cupriavidus metallidurans TaxID=119219 RepID=UPI000492EC12|nr:hypothetical protein [Cupriavidus metallidurans]MDE4918277.1 hypothetical protein [Cupriavidus metallidurans]
MHLNDELPELTGRLTIELFDDGGKLKDFREIENLVVTTGKNWWAARGTNAPPAAMSHMAVGAGAVAPLLGDLTLGGELGRVALASQTTLGNVTTYAAGFGKGIGTGAVTEAAIFNDPAAGTMLNRATFPVVNKGANDTMTITWAVTQN